MPTPTVPNIARGTVLTIETVSGSAIRVRESGGQDHLLHVDGPLGSHIQHGGPAVGQALIVVLEASVNRHTLVRGPCGCSFLLLATPTGKRPPRWLVFGVIGLGSLVAGGILGNWLLAPAAPGDWWPVRWLSIAAVAVGSLTFVALTCMNVGIGLMRLDAGPARGWQLVTAIPLIFLFAVFLACVQLGAMAAVVSAIAIVVRLLIG